MTSVGEDKLRECPCGKTEGLRVEEPQRLTTGYDTLRLLEPYVVCTCGWIGPSRPTRAEAIAAWNRRSLPVEDVEALRLAREVISEMVRYGHITTETSTTAYYVGENVLPTIMGRQPIASRAPGEEGPHPLSKRMPSDAWLREKIEADPDLDVEVRPPGAYAASPPAPDAEVERLREVGMALTAYVDALVRREHGDVAAGRFVDAVAKILNRVPVHEMDAKRRAALSNSGGS